MKKAFTIGEIFTSLVIIGILIAVLAPSIKNLTDKKRREAALFKKAYYALEKAVESSINDSRFYPTGDFSNTNPVSVDGKCFGGATQDDGSCGAANPNKKFFDVIKSHFNVIDEGIIQEQRELNIIFIIVVHYNVTTARWFTIKDNIKYTIAADGINMGDTIPVQIHLDSNDSAFIVGINSNGKMSIMPPAGGLQVCDDVNSEDSQCKAIRYLERQGI